MRYLAPLLVIFSLFLSVPAPAHDEDPSHDAWYRTLMQPDNPQTPCCGESDAYWADEVHVKDGRVFATITDDRPDGPLQRDHIAIGTVIEIPQKKVKNSQGNPTGHSILFGAPGRDGEFYVYCYVQAGGV